MKSSICFVAAVAALGAIASLSQALHAQIPCPTLKVNVPFTFEYGSTQFAPGSYTIEVENSYSMLLRSNGKSALALISTEYSPHPIVTAKVAFERSGDRYLLEDVWIPGTGAHLSVYRSRAQMRAARERAAARKAQTQVAIRAIEVGRAAAGN